MNILEAQRDMRRAYVGGGPGVIVSGLVWMAAAFVQQNRGIGLAFVVLFVGGFFIFPLSTLVSRFVFRRQKEMAGNPLGMTALESTIAMIGGLFGAWLFLKFNPALVFPFAAIVVGTHYAVFKTVYGNSLFWILGAILTAIGVWQILGSPVLGGVALWVAAAELAFGIFLTVRARSVDASHLPV
jgi:hypothetical protein